MIFCFLFGSIISKFKTSKVKLFNIIPNTLIVPENQYDTNLERNSSVLITGGSGLVGRHLTALLLSEGYTVSHLSRNSNKINEVSVHRWDPEKKIIEPGLF
jgi:5,10-methylene-tetrahydrofolate dehydrogenase/methenyl tetrahydrofolate cyclohydrolase